ncbi:MAG: hypothetical protein U0936_18580 [Planctomycetaceae bacterium]
MPDQIVAAIKATQRPGLFGIAELATGVSMQIPCYRRQQRHHTAEVLPEMQSRL